MKRIHLYTELNTHQRLQAVDQMRQIMVGRAREFGEMRPVDWPEKIASRLRWVVTRAGLVFGPKEAWGLKEVRQ